MICVEVVMMYYIYFQSYAEAFYDYSFFTLIVSL